MNDLIDHLTRIVTESIAKNPALLREKIGEYQKMAISLVDKVRRNEIEMDSAELADKLLPHPVRALSIGLCEAQAAVIYEPSNLAIFSILAKEDVPVNDAIAHLWQSNKKFATQFANAPGNRNAGGTTSTAFPIYFKESNGKTFTFYNSLIRDLMKTDIGDNVPATLLRAPFRSTYLKFGDEPEDFGVYVNNAMTGNHEIEGCYVSESIVPNMVMNEGSKIVDLMPDTPTRIVNLMFVGRPKSTALDDATHNITLYIQDSVPLTIEEVLSRHFKYYSSREQAQENSKIDGYSISESTIEEWKQIEECVKLLSKCAVYLNCADTRLTERKERTELLTRLKTLGNKKASKQERKLKRLYDYVLVGTKESAFEVAMWIAGHEGEHRFVRPHWRRGHIRMQRYGEERAKQKIIFISPVLINKDKLNADTTDREYKVK